MNTAEAQQADRNIGDDDLLRRQIKDWERQGLIAQEQGEAILKYEKVKPKALPIRRLYGRLITLLATLGVILVGVGVIVFVGTNWQLIPTPVRLFLILSVIGVTNLAAYQLKYVRFYPRIGGALLFLGSFFYGAGIFLVVQIYNMNANDPDLLFLWYIGVLPIAYLARSRAMLSLAILVALGQLGWKASMWSIDIDGHAFFALYLIFAATLYSLGMLHLRFARTTIYSMPLTVLGSLTVFSFMFALTFDEVIGELFYRAPSVPTGFIVLISLLSAVAVLSGIVGTVADRVKNRPWGTLHRSMSASCSLVSSSWPGTSTCSST